MMRLRVKCENLSDADLKAQLQIYTHDLMQYPLEAAIKAVRRWPDSNRFWPAWAELRSEVESATRSLESRKLLEQSTVPRQQFVACTDIALTSDKCQCWACQMTRKLNQ